MRISQLVDPPGPFDTLATWESWRKEIDTLQTDDQIPLLIKEADEMIARKKAEADKSYLPPLSTKPFISETAETLTPSEQEALRDDLKEAAALAQKAFAKRT